MQELLKYGQRIKSFSFNARVYLLASFVGSLYFSVFGVLGNLYLLQAGLNESYLGTMISVGSLARVLCAIPAGVLSDRIGRRKALLLAAGLIAVAELILILFPTPTMVIVAVTIGSAAGTIMMVSGSPFLTENSTRDERSHLFSVSMASHTVSGVAGSFLGGMMPVLWGRVLALPADSMLVYRATLLSSLILLGSAVIPYSLIKEVKKVPSAITGWIVKLKSPKLVYQLAVPELLMGLGAGMFVPFLNVYFSRHLGASSTQVGFIFSTMNMVTTVAVLWAPVLGKRYGKVGGAVLTRLLSVPILLVIALTSNLWLAAVAAWVRSALMNMSNPLIGSFSMEVLDARERATVSSMLNMLWSLGWGLSAKLAGYIMQNYSYTMPYYFTVVLYTLSAIFMYRFFCARETELTAAVAD
jgi:MFS family permease